MLLGMERLGQQGAFFARASCCGSSMNGRTEWTAAPTFICANTVINHKSDQPRFSARSLIGRGVWKARLWSGAGLLRRPFSPFLFFSGGASLALARLQTHPWIMHPVLSLDNHNGWPARPAAPGIARNARQGSKASFETTNGHPLSNIAIFCPGPRILLDRGVSRRPRPSSTYLICRVSHLDAFPVISDLRFSIAVRLALRL